MAGGKARTVHTCQQCGHQEPRWLGRCPDCGAWGSLVAEQVVPEPDRSLRVLGDNEHEVVVDPVVLGELRFGILLLPRGRRRTKLERWFEAGVERLRCLPWEAATGLRWAELLADLRRAGRSMPVKDSLIAATALVHDLVVVTRNRADFEKAGVKVVDPFAEG